MIPIVKHGLEKRIRRSKRSLSKKRNQRRLAYGSLIFICFTLLIGLIVVQTASSERNYKLIQRQHKLLKLNTALKDTQRQKVDTLEQLEQKKATEAELKAKIKVLNKKLEAKRRTTQLASVGTPQPTQTPTTYTSTTYKTYKPIKYSSKGNTYSFGYCTYGVKMWRPDIPNGWGNAYAWLGSAQASGWATGYTPRVGAVAVMGNHVALVIGVGSGSFTIKEMNGTAGWNQVNTRTITGSAGFIY